MYRTKVEATYLHLRKETVVHLICTSDVIKRNLEKKKPVVCKTDVILSNLKQILQKRRALKAERLSIYDQFV